MTGNKVVPGVKRWLGVGPEDPREEFVRDCQTIIDEVCRKENYSRVR